MKLYRCDKCAVVYAFAPDIGRVPPCTRTWRETSRSGIIGDYNAYCAGALVPVTLDADPTPVERDHGDRSQGDGREGKDYGPFVRRYIARVERHARERRDAIAGSRRAYWRQARAQAEAQGHIFGHPFTYTTASAGSDPPSNAWHKPSGADS